ncbi:sigma-70 family RNA polymerase sigma factor [Acutalibacter sp. 1XD8-33]|uniref:RNA polymerase sigma factor n=1 Tax=Acutalibacter sp. 1XD8-33 TaxID=2320081 RepID=UPI000EA16E32|nr:sigma-70 family RNA polymerase sigma factor [Acutalibacter sp. 1XD8-33]RKJ41718.1 sigma-70 family RNA polymerase sigma factor [Acutalibacter sp. 1XD8-33]
MEDERIIQLYNQRDEGAVQATREKYGGLCFRIALNLLSVREDAEECVNDVYFAAWRQIPPLLPASLGAFLGRVTRNLAISRYRASTAQKRDRGVGLLLSELEECLPDGNSLDAQVDSRALSRLVSRWLDTLSPEDRTLFVRRYWYGDSLPEISRQTGTAPEALSQRTFRLRKKLKQQLTKEGYSP